MHKIQRKGFLFSQSPWTWFAIAVSIVILDLWTKHLASSAFEYNEKKEVFSFFNLTLRHNTGAAFSFLANAGGWQRWFFTILTTVVSIVLVVWITRVGQYRVLEPLGLALVLGGALGNLYDRVTLGYVVDFIEFHWKNRHFFPAFNIADMAISCGAALLIFDNLLFSHKREAGSRDTRAEESRTKEDQFKRAPK